MFRKNYLISLLAMALFLMGSAAAFAQNAPIRGRVELTKADGTKVPVAGALVEVYRLDVKTKFDPGKTDKKGIFVFAGLPFGAQFVLSISAPNTTPEIQGGIKAGMEDILIPVTEGDGKRWTEEEVRAAIAGSNSTQSTELTAEQKKAQEDRQKEIAAITNKNKKAEETNSIVNSALQEGSKAFEAKNYDLAIAKFDEGYNADQTFEGSAPVMLNNKTLALISRGTKSYNDSIKAADAVKLASRASAKQDFTDAVIASNKALEVLKTATSADPNTQKNYEVNKVIAITNRKNAYRLMAQTGVDRTQGKEALMAFQEYTAIETDPAKKSKAELDLAQTLQDSDEFELAITAFQKILEPDPNNVDALVGLGLSMVNVGYINLDSDPVKGKAQLQEAANYLQKFVDLAPDTHKFKQDAKDTIVSLKEQQKVAPQKITKTTTTPKKKN